MSTLEDKVALVTGGGTGIGRGIALAFGEEGVSVAVCGRRRKPLEETVSLVRESGSEAVALPGDVSRQDQARAIVERTLERLGGLDILVNNAGIGGGGPVHDHSVEVWDQVMGINLRGPFLMARYSLPHMRQAGAGHIFNISSESGLVYYEGSGAYGVSKHALNALSEYIQRENQDHGVRVDTICPGMVVTEMTEGRPGLDHDKCLYPEDIADLVIWLAGRRPNVKIGRPILIQTMENPWT